jgi:hypothetical protein
MTNGVNMPLGVVGGNNVELVNVNAKVRVTNPNGKSITMAPDEFLKQVSENTESLVNGKDFEFQSRKNTKTKKALKIVSAAAATATVATAVLYRKEIGKYMKDFSFQKLWQDIRGLFGKKKPNTAAPTPAPAGYSAEFRANRQKALEETFKNYNPEQVVEQLKNGKTAEELGLNSHSKVVAKKDNSTLKRKQNKYNSPESVAKRQNRLNELRKELNLTESPKNKFYEQKK